MKALKRTLLFAALTFIGSGAFAQAKSDITGKWSVASVDVVDAFYINIDKDSLHVADKMMEQMGGSMDSATKAMTMGMMKTSLVSAFKTMYITVDEKGGIYESSKNKKIGQYNADKNTMTFVNETTKEEKTVPVEVKNGLMKFAILDEESTVNLWCRKS